MTRLPCKIAVSALGAALGVFVVGWRTAPQAATSTPVSVTTYHYDNLRTGWNSNETVLTPGNVKSTTFGLLHSVTLDQQVDAQPLIVPGESITAGTHQGIHDVVYVATENNTIYAIDASSGIVLLNPNFGPAVPKPLGCGNNSTVVGINGTPVKQQHVCDRLHGGKSEYQFFARRSHLHHPCAESQRPERPYGAGRGGRVAQADQRRHLQFQCHGAAAAPGIAGSERKHLCGIRQLLRFQNQQHARVGLGLVERNSHSPCS